MTFREWIAVKGYIKMWPELWMIVREEIKYQYNEVRNRGRRL